MPGNRNDDERGLHRLVFHEFVNIVICFDPDGCCRGIAVLLYRIAYRDDFDPRREEFELWQITLVGSTACSDESHLNRFFGN